jgi:hypothetical protein
MNPFGAAIIGLGIFALVVGLTIALMEWWDARHVARKHKHA